MKLFLIKVGKAYHTIRRDGMIRGGKRVYQAFVAMFRKVGSGDVLFITGGVGDSARYRTTYVAETLEAQGVRTAITLQDNPWLTSYADKFSVFVFHRVLYTQSVAVLMTRIKAQGKEMIFETDDLVYDPVYLEYMDFYKTMNTFERKLYEHGVGGEILADPVVTTCTTSTNFLAEKLRERGKNVFVVRNRLSREDVALAERLVREVQKDTTVVRVAYLSGTLSHNKDFSTITAPLIYLLRQHPQMRLVLVGPLDIDDALRAFHERIECLPFLSRAKYFTVLAQMDIVLAPLEIGNPFCESKSELKWFEAGLVGVPTVASATGTFREAITDGVDGWVAMTDEEWQTKLGSLITDVDFRIRMGAHARQMVLQKYITEKADDTEYYQYIKSKL
ncbi:MAG: glycosyltransferase [Minisyncoccota bacterium]